MTIGRSSPILLKLVHVLPTDKLSQMKSGLLQTFRSSTMRQGYLRYLNLGKKSNKKKKK